MQGNSVLFACNAAVSFTGSVSPAQWKYKGVIMLVPLFTIHIHLLLLGNEILPDIFPALCCQLWNHACMSHTWSGSMYEFQKPTYCSSSKALHTWPEMFWTEHLLLDHFWQMFLRICCFLAEHLATFYLYTEEPTLQIWNSLIIHNIYKVFFWMCKWYYLDLTTTP